MQKCHKNIKCIIVQYITKKKSLAFSNILIISLKPSPYLIDYGVKLLFYLKNRKIRKLKILTSMRKKHEFYIMI